METTPINNAPAPKRELSLIDKFSQTMGIYEQKNLAELLQNSSFTPAKFKQVVITEIKKNVKLQEAFLKNPASLFASILHCAELDLSPSQMIGEFFFIPFKDTITHSRIPFIIVVFAYIPNSSRATHIGKSS